LHINNRIVIGRWEGVSLVCQRLELFHTQLGVMADLDITADLHLPGRTQTFKVYYLG